MVRCTRATLFFRVSVVRASVHLSVTLSPPKPLGVVEVNQTCYIIFPHGKGVREQHCFRASVVHMSVTLSPPKPLAEFNQTCFIISPLGKGVREQHYFSVRATSLPYVRRPSICLLRYLLLNHWAEFNRTCYITFPRGKGVRKQH